MDHVKFELVHPIMFSSDNRLDISAGQIIDYAPYRGRLAEPRDVGNAGGPAWPKHSTTGQASRFNVDGSNTPRSRPLVASDVYSDAEHLRPMHQLGQRELGPRLPSAGWGKLHSSCLAIIGQDLDKTLGLSWLEQTRN